MARSLIQQPRTGLAWRRNRRGQKPAPLQKQLIERLQQAILAGRLPAGSLLPSSRLLSAEMGVSRNTVVIADEHLAAVGDVVADKKARA